MNRRRPNALIAVCSSSLSFRERRIVLRQIIDDLQHLCDDRSDRQALHRLLQTIRRSMTSIASADEDCWEDILRELLQLRATIMRLQTGAAITYH
ncbi:hypothetical protein CPT34_07575 [Rhizobium sophoriradicis]|uniref:Uncharacterized protein n=1 Tax=Rhizobium sophoriradicis TaxID=1535245 RepID=A0A2A5KXM3_9HYPH|nr:hypothetical protein Kim5_PC00052 [Rhizobium sp. Kim5]PCK81799.1 hypothetical protein CPT34_07575 [Rhizobium sophoriradicis]PCK86989.1 hypothetical protein CPT32_11135 [Rhizobium sophoriradicis]RSB92052.1 hypothetical protein EFR00_24005 [Rhizobium sophoriradicis]